MVGTYTARYTVPSSLKISPQVNYRYDTAYSGENVETPASQNNDNQDSPIDATAIDPENLTDLSGYGTVKKPSWEENFNKNEQRPSLTVNQLFNQFDDNGQTVLSMKDYGPNDVVTVNDHVATTQYDTRTNETTLTFASDNDPSHFLKFKGNLTGQFRPGTNFNKKMKVTELGNNPEFRIPTYFQYFHDNNNLAPAFNQD